MDLSAKFKQVLMSSGKPNRRFFSADSEGNIIVDKSAIRVIFDINDFSEVSDLIQVVDLFRKKIIGAKFIICNDKKAIEQDFGKDSLIVTIDQFSLFGRMDKDFADRLNSPKSDIVIAAIPLHSKLTNFVAGHIETRLLVTFGELQDDNYYDLVINENSDDWNKKLDVLLFYLKQLNLKR